MTKCNFVFCPYIKYSGDDMSKEEFKGFAKKHPELANSVLSGKTTWQNLYQLYDIYGEKSNVWDNFLGDRISKELPKEPFKELFQTFKNLDVEQVQKGVTNLQKTIGLLQDIGLGSNQNINTYEPKPLYRYFDD